MRRAVAEVAARYGVDRDVLPVPIRQLVRDEGWQVRFAALPGAYGYAVIVRQVRIMVINEALTSGYQRMAMAHEFGHGVAAHGGVHLLRSGTALGAWLHSREEREASRVAGWLLVPGWALAEYGDERELAAACDVPVELVRLRREDGRA